MTIANRWPQRGDAAVEIRFSTWAGARDRIGAPVTIASVTPTLVITSDGARYNRDRLYPIAEGSGSPRQLRPVSDVAVLTAQGRERLAEVASHASNLAALARRTPEECVGALASIITAASAARAGLLQLMSSASRLEQESDR